MPVVVETSLPGLNLLARGKVRDIYDLGDHLLIVATDRISAFDYVLPTGIPDKGKVLNLLSAFWFEFLRDLVPSHMVTVEVESFPAPASSYPEILAGRSMLARKARMFPVECVVRGYLSGSGYAEYKQSGTVSGIHLPFGLKEAARLSEPIFTPARKAATGHDENISFEQVADMIGHDSADRLRSLSLEIYRRAALHAEQRGILLADTKFEFGVLDDRIVLCDEAITPDSSRFWPKDSYEPGGPQASYDKQFVRDYLIRSGWTRTPPAPPLPEEVVRGTSERYRRAYLALTGRALS